MQKLSLFVAHFRRRPKTPLSNTSPEPSLKKVLYQKDIDKHFDQDTVKWTQLFPDDKSGNPDRSDTEIEQNKKQKQSEIHKTDKLAIRRANHDLLILTCNAIQHRTQRN